MMRLVAIGCSWGGLTALGTMFDHLPSELDAAIVVAQHRLPSRSNLAEILAPRAPWPVREVDDKEGISPRRVYLAPPGYHLLVEDGRFALSTEGHVRFSRPSIDVLFESVAAAYTDRAVGIILTGANDDGADGVTHIVRRGGVVIVQDPSTAERIEMPRAAIATGMDVVIAQLEEIGPLLGRMNGPR
jgi:two-component system chemotaxis response regulator CheB